MANAGRKAAKIDGRGKMGEEAQLRAIEKMMESGKHGSVNDMERKAGQGARGAAPSYR